VLQRNPPFHLAGAGCFMGFRDTASSAPWRTKLDATIAAQYARARALARLGGASSQSTHVIPAHAVILEGALIRSRRRRPLPKKRDIDNPATNCSHQGRSL
jgi:hypothetical protein